MFRLGLSEVKEWLRIDGDEENNLVTSLMSAAESYLHTATGRKSYGSQTDLAKTVCNYLISNWYENRDFYNPTPNAIRNPALSSMIVQLQTGGADHEDND